MVEDVTKIIFLQSEVTPVRKALVEAPANGTPSTSWFRRTTT